MAAAYQFVNDRWNDKEAAALKEDEVGLLIYRSNLLGSDLRITNFGGGNTSCKVKAKDPVSGVDTEVMWVKGSGGDLATLKRDGLAALYLERLRNLEKVYRGLANEDEMVELFNHCLFDLKSKAPSIDTPLHAFLPFRHIDHLHPDAAIAVAAAQGSETLTKELFKGTIGWVPWQRPGFDLGLRLRDCLEKNPGIKGIILGSHGLFTWGDTSKSCYYNTLDIIEQCAAFVEKKVGKSVFGGIKVTPIDPALRKKQAARIAPLLRGFCSSHSPMVGHFTDDARVLEFVNSKDMERLAAMGTSCPDHFLRTKIRPLVLAISPTASPDDAAVKNTILQQFEAYRSMYTEYYSSCKHPDSPAMRDPNPVVLLYPGVGMLTFAKDKSTARIAAEFYVNAVNVMRGAEALSSYTALPLQEAFDIEYWLLEEAKLQRAPKPKPLTGKIAFVSGSGGGIGKAIAKKFAAEGACVVLTDNDAARLAQASSEFTNAFGKDPVASVVMDVTSETEVRRALDTARETFGGVDIIVNCAGISISKSLADHTADDWDLLYDILVKGQFLVSQAGVEILKMQAMGGDIVNIVSKNALVSGPNNAGYGSAKAAQLHLSRLLAAELGADKIRVNSVNPDAVIADSKIWEGAWAEGRAKAYGIKVEDLPAFYAGRTLLNEIILPEDIANACFALVGGLLNKSTGNVLNVDGGLPAAFTR